MSRVTSLMVVGLLCVCGSLAQTAPPLRNVEDVDKFLAGSTLKECKTHFHECAQNLSDLQQWADANYPIGQRLSAANLQLMTENNHLTVVNRELQSEVTENRVELFFWLVAAGVGLVAVSMTVRFLWRKWRLSPAGKQLAVLVLGALWMTAAVFVALDNPSLSVHPINLAVTVVVYSLPAILFAGIAFWWFEKAPK
jgi:hypothetical protein